MMELPTISKTKLKNAWRNKIQRTEQELRLERIEQMLDMLLVEKIMKCENQPKPQPHDAYFTPAGGKEIYLGQISQLTVTEKGIRFDNDGIDLTITYKTK